MCALYTICATHVHPNVGQKRSIVISISFAFRDFPSCDIEVHASQTPTSSNNIPQRSICIERHLNRKWLAVQESFFAAKEPLPEESSEHGALKYRYSKFRCSNNTSKRVFWPVAIGAFLSIHHFAVLLPTPRKMLTQALRHLSRRANGTAVASQARSLGNRAAKVVPQNLVSKRAVSLFRSARPLQKASSYLKSSLSRCYTSEVR